MKRWLLLFLGCTASAACVYWLLHRVDISAVLQTMKSAGWAAWIAAAAIYLGGFIPRALRWQLMLSPHGRFRLWDLGRCIMLGYTGNNLLPFRLGEVVRALLFNRMTGVSRTTALASIGAERLLDAFTLVMVLAGVSFNAATDGVGESHLRPVFVGAALLAGIAVSGFGAAWFATDTLVRWARRISPRLGSIAANSAASIAFLRRPRLLAAVGMLSLLIWIIEGSMFVVLAAALGVPSPVIAGFLSLTVINLGILVPAAPGYVGVFQAASVLAFAALTRPESEGFAFGVLAHSAQFLPLTLLGLLLAIPFWGVLANIVQPSRPQSNHA